MKSSIEREQAVLAINAIIRGLELGEISFQYDERWREITSLAAAASSAVNEGRKRARRASSS